MKIAVCMSLYQTQLDYLRLQINSIYRSARFAGVNIDIIIRNDDTQLCKNISEYLDGKVKTVHLGGNIGFAGSYIKLLNACRDEYDYVLFSDQDDIWTKTKVAVIISELKEAGIWIGRSQPFKQTKRCSRLPKTITDSIVDRHNQNRFGKVVICYGHNLAFNIKYFRRELLYNKLPPSHDIFLYYYALTKRIPIKISKEITTLYRQHDLQVVGASSTEHFIIRNLKNLVLRLKTLCSLDNIILRHRLIYFWMIVVGTFR